MKTKEKKLERFSNELISNEELVSIKGGHPTWKWRHTHTYTADNGSTVTQVHTWWGFYGTDDITGD